MTDIILHHYEISPYSEKVRIGLGLKGLAWGSVEIPVIMPKPDLTALTGGYRKTPVLQIGADIYCDSQLIMRELERRHPTPSFYPAGRGAADALAWWAEKTTFSPAVSIAFAKKRDVLPEGFLEDLEKRNEKMTGLHVGFYDIDIKEIDGYLGIYHHAPRAALFNDMNIQSKNWRN